MTKLTAPETTIICMKWGTKYGAEYVNKLYGMVDRNLTLPFHFVCFTDDATGIRSEVSILPLPFLQLPKGTPERGWNKLSTLQQGLGGLTGQALFLDLDIVIVDNIDDLLTYPAPFAIIQDAKLSRQMIGNSSVYRFEIGRYHDVLDYFQQNFHSIQKEHRNEQAYLSAEIHKRGELNFWPHAWCPSFKYHCMKHWPLAYFQDATIPKDAKILIFHGHPVPSEAILGETYAWYRPVRPTPWLKEYWRE